MTASGNETDHRLFGATRVAMPEGARPLRPRDDRRFAAWVGLATLLHALLLLAFIRAEPRRLGDAAGIENAIAVEFVPDPDPSSRSTVADRSAGQPAPPAAPPAPPPAAPPSPPAQPPSPPPPPEPVTAPAPPPPDPPPPDPPQQATEAATEPPALLPTLTAPDAAEPAPPTEVAKNEPKPPRPAEPTPKPAEPTKPVEPPQKPAREPPPKQAAPPKPKPTPPTPPAPPQRTANLDLTNPAARPQTFNAPVGGGSGGVERPPGITRSGANDLFAREVIRALQRTMPQLRDTFGRVTVRLTLDKNGNHKETIVLRPSNLPGLDRSVVFATQQSSFPLPPAGHKPDDLIFFVTYIYR